MQPVYPAQHAHPGFRDGHRAFPGQAESIGVLNGQWWGDLMAVVISAAAQAVGRLPPLLAVTVGAAALILVVITELWGPVSHFGRLAHEGAHSMVGSCLNAAVRRSLRPGSRRRGR